MSDFGRAADLERALIESFVIREKRDRYLGFIARRKSRRKFIDELYHVADFDPALVREIASSRPDPAEIHEALRSLGAPEECQVVSVHAEIDRAALRLADALTEVVGYREGRRILHRRTIAH